MTNEQLAECIRSHILALRAEQTTRFAELNERFDRLEQKIDRLACQIAKQEEWNAERYAALSRQVSREQGKGDP